ncbi:MAG: YicC family protein [Deltaproteobacteria bacterium]|nr:YicC family protein [Deltaproteobacteria bacterium]
MRSMTGFGRAELAREGIHIVAEVRALNHRFFELKLNLPRAWGAHEAEIRKIVQSIVARGRVELFVRYSRVGPPKSKLQVNDELARMYIRELRRLGRSLKLNGKLGLEAILQRPEVFHVIEEDEEPRLGAELGLEALQRALKTMDTERVREGRALKRDFELRLKTLASAVPRLDELAADARTAIRANFETRIRELLAELPVNEKRLYEEASAAAQHGDITEEMTRLRIHLDAMSTLLKRTGPIGKSIEFLLQEINRELNTIGAKAQNAKMSQITVEMKGEVEKMREQVQNIE